MSTTLRVWVYSHGQHWREPAEAFPTKTAGLVVNADPIGEGWAVTHEADGVAVAKVPDCGTGQALALLLGGVCDWTLPALVIQGTPAIRQRWHQVISEAGLTEYQQGMRATPGSLLAGAS